MTDIKSLFIVLVLCFSYSCSNNDSNTDSDDNIDDELETPTLELSLSEIAQDSPNEITWVPRADMRSRNGDSMGYGVILNPNSSKVFIFLDGGGACYNPTTCSGNRDSYTENDFNEDFTNLNALIINRTSANNQFRDWNFIFIPYATGDVHSGSNASANVPFNGPTNQLMTGYNNVTLVLNDIKNYFDNGSVQLDEIVFSGSSAGGYGTLFNCPQFADIFGTEMQTTVLIDSGQLFLNDTILTPCLEDQWSNLWNWENTFPADFNTLVTGTYNYDAQQMYEYVAEKYPNFNFGFLSYYEDEVIRGFYSFGQDNCPAFPDQLLDGAIFKSGLLDLKESVLDTYDNWKVFYANGNSHTFLGSSTLNQTINGMTLNQWIEDLRSGTAIDLVE